ncbi:MAG: hypothetical protein ACI4QR_06900, partial [Eubacteriales bacterium]
LCDIFALEFYTKEKLSLITGGDNTAYTSSEYFASRGYIPTIDVRVHIGDGVENSRSFTVSAMSDLIGKTVTEENYPVVRAYINAIDIPSKNDLISQFDKKFGINVGE